MYIPVIHPMVILRTLHLNLVTNRSLKLSGYRFKEATFRKTQLI